MKFWPCVTSSALVLVTLAGCAATTSKPAPASSSDGTVSPDCQNVMRDAMQLHAAAVRAADANRDDAALQQFDQAITELRRIIDGAIKCSPDTVSRANNALHRVEDDRDIVLRRPK